MGARHARRIEEPIHEHEMDRKAQGLSTPEEYRVAICDLMGESVRVARRLAAEGRARFPDDSELARLSRLLDLPPGADALDFVTPDPSSGLLWYPLPLAEEKPEPATPEEFLAAVHNLLDQASPTRAQQVAAEGHARFPDHPELERLCRLLTLPPARSVPQSGKRVSYEKAFRWLDENEIHYRNQWVALNENGLLSSAPTLKELLRKIEPIDPEDPPLLHHIH